MISFQRILVPVDFSPCSRHALDVAVALADRVAARIDVLHAWTAPAYVSPSAAVQLSSEHPAKTLAVLAEEEARKDMAAFLAGAPQPAGGPIGVRIEFGFEAEAILKAAEGYDLVVMGTHGRTGLAHLMMGSVVERVVRRCKVPVLTVRQP